MDGDNELGDYVIVIPGLWQTVNGVGLVFQLSQTLSARIVKLSSHTTCRELHRQIIASYGVDVSRYSIRTTYCMPPMETVPMEGKIHYVDIVEDSDVTEFKRKMKVYRGLNMLVSFEAIDHVEVENVCPCLHDVQNSEVMYDTDGLGNSELLALVEVLEASHWMKRPRSDEFVEEEVARKVSRNAFVGELNVGATEKSLLMEKTDEEYISLAEGGSGMATLDSPETDTSTQFSSDFNELARLAETDANGLRIDSQSGIISSAKDMSQQTQLSGNPREQYFRQEEGGRGMPTLDINDEVIDTQFSPEFYELARLAEMDGVRGDDEPNNVDVPSFDLGIDDFAVGDNSGGVEGDLRIPSPQGLAVDGVEIWADGIENSGNVYRQEVATVSECRSLQRQEDAFRGTSYAGFTQRSVDDFGVFGVAMGNIESDSTEGYDNITGHESNLDLANTTIYRGRVFECKKDMYMCLSVYAVENTFCFKMDKSDKSRWVAVCVDRRCKWRVRAVPVNQTDRFVVTKTVLDHTCDVSSRARYVEKATAAVIARLVQRKYSDGKRGPRAVDLMDIVFEQLKVNISYMKAWNIREIAVCSARGSPEENYLFLSTYLHLLKITNPGSLTDIVTSPDKDGNRQFKYLFMALGACVKGFKFLRRVVVIDGTHLKGKYKGCLVAASGQDANLQIFPLAFGVVDSENEDSWVWFLKKLSLFVRDDPNLVFVSDRHNAIYAALKQVYPKAHHGACTVHLWRNVKARFKSNGLATAMSKAARAYTVGDFSYWWEEIKKRSPACCSYLTRIGFHHWALSHFKGQRYNIMSTNIAESLNHAMGKAVDFPIVSMLEFVRTMLMRWFSDRKEESGKCSTRCPPRIEGVLMDKFSLSTSCSVRPCSRNIFQVTNKHGHVFTVDVQRKSCTCKAFDILKLPCPHALAACSSKKLDIYALVDVLYLRHAWQLCYEEPILPLPRREDIDIPEEIKGLEVLPPPVRRQSGRPKTLRVASVGEDVPDKGGCCTRCGLRGHNRATCGNAI